MSVWGCIVSDDDMQIQNMCVFAQDSYEKHDSYFYWNSTCQHAKSTTKDPRPPQEFSQNDVFKWVWFWDLFLEVLQK